MVVAKPQRAGIRLFSVSDRFGKLLLFYMPVEGGIDLIRVIHASRDIGSLLAEEFFS